MFRTLFLTALATSFVSGEILINEIAAIDAGRVLRWDENDQPYAGAGPAWWSPSFDSATWNQGSLPIGFSINPIATDLRSTLNNVSPSFYVRKSFEASPADAASGRPLSLEINFNDGFIAWLNGVEIARENMGAEKAHIYHDQVAHRAASSSTASKTFPLGISSDLLKSGQNVLALQVNNESLSGNMRLDFALVIDDTGGPETSLISKGTSVEYLPGLREPSSDLVEPALPGGDPSDWIELHNNGDAEVDLTGWSLSDDSSDPSQWVFPTGSTIPADGYLLVLADNPDAPIPGAIYLHTNFKLSSGGDFLGLYDADGTLRSSLAPEFPKQFANYSFGTSTAGGLAYHALPTPGVPNSTDPLSAKVEAPDFDHKGGFYDSSVTVALTSETNGAVIRYTTDGTEPTLSNGTVYLAPLVLDTVNSRKGHVIRARAFRDGFIPSSIKTHTFLIDQDARLRTAPSLIYAGEPQRSLYDPFGVMAINGGTYRDQLWQPSGPSDYNNVINRGRAYERPIHAEFYFPDGRVGFRSDVGLRVASSSYSRPRMQLSQTSSSPWPANSTQKPSFNLYFRDEYGNPSVNLPLNGIDHPVKNYERFRIRAGKNDIRNPFIIDELVRRLSRDMGNGASVGIINSLYINAELKGFYNMVERLREPFFRELHRSEDNAQWDVLQYEGNDNIAEGDKVAWNDMISRVNATTTLPNWERVLEVADVANIADYFLLNIYGATWDWPHNNWVAAKERSPAGRYRLYVWDAEGAMNNAGGRSISQEMIRTFIVGSANGQSGERGTRGELRDLWSGLNRWSEFRLLFADRIHKHLFNNGILDDRDYANSHLKSEFDKLVDEFGPLLSVMNGQNVETNAPRLWARAQTGRRTYLLGPRREEFRDNNLWPETTPPSLSQLGGSVSAGYPLKVTSESGDVYFTVDGTDPRLPGGEANLGAISQPGSAQEVTLMTLGSQWRYDDSSGDLGTAWREPSFDDSTWSSGAAPLGYGGITDSDTGESHAIVTDVNNNRPRQPTTYFRRTFEVEDATTYIELLLKIRSDAGTVIYLNGNKVFRDSNIAADADYSFIPDDDNSDGNEGDLDEYLLDALFLIEGTNTIAVELHNNPNNSDMVLDVQLEGKRTNPNNFPLFIDHPVRVMARSLDKGVWSALTVADFTVDSQPANSGNLAIGELLYNPIGADAIEAAAGFDDGDLFEFLRIENTGSTNVDLHQVRFTRGIAFDFTASDIRSLSAGGAALIVANLEAFRLRYGSGFNSIIAGQYSGKLSNEGETLRLVGRENVLIHEFKYGITSPWPDLSTLDGHSLKIVDRAVAHDLATNWQPSEEVGGTPDGDLGFGSWLARNFNPGQLADGTISGPESDPDGDGWSNFWEFALGTLPLDRSDFPSTFETAIVTEDDAQFLTLSFTRKGGVRNVRFSAELSDDLRTWTDGGLRVLPDIKNPDDSTTVTFRHPAPLGGTGGYLRLKASN